jgi:TonB family protein
MPSRRLLLICTGLSVLLHLLVLWLAYLFPQTTMRPEEVITIDLADIPRATDFLPPKPGVLEGRHPQPAPPPRARREEPERKPTPPREMTGRVPDLPVKPDLPPEKSFPAPRPKQEQAEQEKGVQGQPAKETPGGAAKAEPAQAEPAQTASEGGRSAAPGPQEAPASLRDLTPSLGKMVMARREPTGGRGKGEGSGSAVGTGTKASSKEGVTEESGGGFHLTSLNAPEIQYISYFASIKRKIELVWQYPYDAAVAGIQGECMIDFVIGRDGKLESVELIRGSGYKVLDDEAIRSVRKASPFDPIPADYKIPRLEIRGRFVYINGGALRVR